MIKYFIANEELYEAQLRKYYNSLLNGRLFSLDIEMLSDEELIESITDYDCNEGVANNNFCTWVYIGDIFLAEYNGINYEYVTFLSGGKMVFKINLSQFKYAMNSFERTYAKFSHYDSKSAEFVCTIDGQHISPKQFFQENKGDKLFVIYNFPAATELGTEKQCYFFAHDCISPKDIREYIVYAQYHTLRDVLATPAKNIPLTTIKIVSGSRSNRIDYSKNSRCEESDVFAIELFNREFRSSFENLLSRNNDSIIRP